jgi:hypothetical protein
MRPIKDGYFAYVEFLEDIKGCLEALKKSLV